jgi:hypothetical protein
MPNKVTPSGWRSCKPPCRARRRAAVVTVHAVDQTPAKSRATEVARYHWGVQFGTVDRIDYEERYDPWFIHPEEELEAPLVPSGLRPQGEA